MAADPLALTTEAYVARALEILRERCPEEGDEALELGIPQWKPDSGENVIARFGTAGIFRLFPDIWDPVRVCAVRELGEMADGLTEYRDLVAALEADPIIGPRLGNEVVGGAGLGGGSWQVLSLARELVDGVIKVSGGLDADSTVIHAAVDRAVRYLRRQREEVTTLAPLADFSSEAQTISLSTDLTINELSSEEICAALTLGGWTVSFAEPNPIFGRGGLMTMVPPTFAIRVSHTVPVRVGGGTNDEVEASVQARSEAGQRVEEVLFRLRAFKRGRVGVRSIFVLIPGLFYGPPVAIVGGRSGYTGQGRSAPYELSAEEGADFQAFFAGFVAPRSNRILDTAYRRFGDAADRSRSEDEIVDLVIAAESLFLDRGSTGELRYRLSVRAASFLGETAERRRQILAFMQKAYDARSGVVHNGRLDEARLRNLKGETATAAAFTDELEDLVRSALKKAARLIESGEPFPPPNWDELLFPV